MCSGSEQYDLSSPLVDADASASPTAGVGEGTSSSAISTVKASGGKLDVVVLGAGVAGRRVQLLLGGDKRYNVHLVDAAPFTEYTPSVLRALVEPSHAHHIVVPHERHGVLTARAVCVHMRTPDNHIQHGAQLPLQPSSCSGDGNQHQQLSGTTTSPQQQQSAKGHQLQPSQHQPLQQTLQATATPHHPDPDPTLQQLHPGMGSNCTGCVELAGGALLPFHYLVVCVGSGYIAPIKYGSPSSRPSAAQAAGCAAQGAQEPTVSSSGTGPNGPGGNSAGTAGAGCTDRADTSVFTAPSTQKRIEQLHAAARQLAAAGSVLILGGGAVGVELAGEVACKYGKAKNVTLVTSATSLLPRMPPRAGRYAASWLARQGVRVMCGERVVAWPPGGRMQAGPGTVTLASGQHLSAHLVFDCTGLGHGGGIWEHRQLLASCQVCSPSCQQAQASALHAQQASESPAGAEAASSQPLDASLAGVATLAAGHADARELLDVQPDLFEAAAGPTSVSAPPASQTGAGATATETMEDSSSCAQGLDAGLPGVSEAAHAAAQASQQSTYTAACASAPQPGTGSNATRAPEGAVPFVRGLRTTATLQVAGSPCVYVAGDAAVTGWEATALAAELHAACITRNIMRAATGQPPVPYPAAALPWAASMLGLTLHAQPTIAAISLGKYCGVLQVGQIVLCGCLAALVKVIVEWMQLGLARRSWLLTRLWMGMEATGVVLCAVMQTRWGVWLLGPFPGGENKLA